MEHPQVMPPSLQTLAPKGNFSDSGIEDKSGLKN